MRRGPGVRRAALAAAGVALVVAGVVAGRVLPSGQVVGAVLWLAAAVVVHDAVVAPAVVMVQRALRGLLAGSVAAGRAATCALVVAGVLTLVAVPGLVVRAVGPRNPSVHPTDYAAVLAVVWAAALAVVLVAAVVARLSRRRPPPGARAGRSSSSTRTSRSRGAPAGAAGEAPGPSTS